MTCRKTFDAWKLLIRYLLCVFIVTKVELYLRYDSRWNVFIVFFFYDYLFFITIGLANCTTFPINNVLELIR